MKIERFTVYNPTLEMDSPFVTSLRRVNSLETVILKIETDNGYSGWGEAPTSPQVTGETPDSSLAALDLVLPKLLGEEPFNREGIHGKMASLLKGNSASKAGVDIALHDLLGRILGEPLWKLLGGFRSNRMCTDFTVSLMEPEDMAKKAKELVSEGFSSLKIKLGGKPGLDLERLKEIDASTGGKASYRIDANQGWTRTESLRFIEGINDIDVEFIEQPVKDEDLSGMKTIRQRSSVPIMADESVHGPESAAEVIRRGAADYLNIKLSKAGGFWPALKVSALAEASHVPCMVGGMSSTGILATAAAHFAAGRSIISFRDLDMGTSISENVIEKGGSYLEGNCRVLAEGSGLGIDRINEKTIEPPAQIYQL